MAWKAGLRPGAPVDIWMPLLGAAVVRRPDLVGCCERNYLQTGVIPFRVYLGHCLAIFHVGTLGMLPVLHGQLERFGQRWSR